MKLEIAETNTNMVVSYSLTCNISRSDMPLNHHGAHVHKTSQDGSCGYTIRPAKSIPPVKSLWIHSKCIEFTGTVTVISGFEEGWTVGIVQTIYESNRNGHYQGGVNRLLKLDTSLGPLKDGEKNTIFYPDTEPLAAAVTRVSTNDEPNFQLPVKYKEKDLVSTSGQDVFRSYLAVVREKDKSIALLSHIDWTISWAGDYAAGPETWEPSNTAQLFTASGQIVDETLHANLLGKQPPSGFPASLRMAEAEKFCRLYEEGEWKRCGMNGNVKEAKETNLTNWTMVPPTGL